MGECDAKHRLGGDPSTTPGARTAASKDDRMQSGMVHLGGHKTESGVAARGKAAPTATRKPPRSQRRNRSKPAASTWRTAGRLLGKPPAHRTAPPHRQDASQSEVGATTGRALVHRSPPASWRPQPPSATAPPGCSQATTCSSCPPTWPHPPAPLRQPPRHGTARAPPPTRREPVTCTKNAWRAAPA